ncbi:MAG: hypothetical protein AAGB22_08910, partial [Bacteroidota bacterium]
IPMGGNRVRKSRWYLNLMVTFLVSGIWHGASWNFVLWGALNGSYLVVAVATQGARERWNRLLFGQRLWLERKFQMLATFSLFTFSLLFFRAQHFSDSMTLLRHGWQQWAHQLSNLDSLRDSVAVMFPTASAFYFMLASGLLFVVGERLIGHRSITEVLPAWPKWQRWAFYYLVVVWILFFRAPDLEVNFVYFQF